jgi:hypothetical protein
MGAISRHVKEKNSQKVFIWILLGNDMDVEAARGHNMVEEILDIVVMSASGRGD